MIIHNQKFTIATKCHNHILSYYGTVPKNFLWLPNIIPPSSRKFLWLRVPRLPLICISIHHRWPHDIPHDTCHDVTFTSLSQTRLSHPVHNTVFGWSHHGPRPSHLAAYLHIILFVESQNTANDVQISEEHCHTVAVSLLLITSKSLNN